MKKELKWAVIMTVVSLIWLFALKLLGYQEGPKANQFDVISAGFYGVQFVLYYLAIRERRSSQRGYISRRDGFFTGLIVTLFYVLMIPVSVFVFTFLINPHFFTDMIDAAVSAGESLHIVEGRINLWSFIVNSMILGGIVGGLSSAVAGYILENKPQKLEE